MPQPTTTQPAAPEPGQPAPGAARGLLGTLHRWERWALLVVALAAVAFGGLVLKRSAFGELRRTDADVFFRAAWAVRSGVDLYAPLSERDWHYVYPQFLAVAMAPLAERPTPSQVESRLDRRSAALRARAARGELDEGRLAAALERERRDAGLLREALAADRGAYLPYWVSVSVWYLLGLGCLVLSVHWLALAAQRCTGVLSELSLSPAHRLWWTLRFWPFVFCAPSLMNGLSRGQSDALVLLAVAGMIRCAAGGLGFRAGLWLSLAASIKVFPAFLGVYGLWRRDWRLVAGAVVGTVALLVVLPSLVHGPTRMWEYNLRWLQTTALPGLGLGDDASRREELIGLTHPDNQSLKAVLHNYDQAGVPLGARAADPAAWVRGGALAGVALLTVVTLRALARRRGDSGRGGDPAAPLGLGALAVLMLAASPVCHMHYFAFALPLVVALVALHARAHPAGSLSALGWLLGLGYLAVYAAARVQGVMVGPTDTATLLLMLGVPMWTNLFVWLYGVAAARREADRAAP